MFLKKAIKLSAFGRFADASVRGGQFAPVTLLYAGNGRGKTTLCAALRSFQQNDPQIVLARKSFGESKTPEIQFLLDSGVASFSEAGWKNQSTDLHIFDNQFVIDNVHDGSTINSDQRRNLYRIAVGEMGVALAKKLEEIDTRIAEVSNKLASVQRVLQQHVPTGMDIKKYVAVPEDADLDKKLAVARDKLNAANSASRIHARPFLAPVTVPIYRRDIRALCIRTIDDIQASALNLVQTHLAEHVLGANAEDWIEQGRRSGKTDKCPYCGQPVSSSTLAAAYDGYFGATYSGLKLEIQNAIVECERDLSEAGGMRCVRALEQIREDCSFWEQYIKVDMPVSVTDVESSLAALRAAALSLLKRKSQSPLDAIDDFSEWTVASEKWGIVAKAIEITNAKVEFINSQIGALKQEAHVAQKPAIEQEITRLEATRERHTPTVRAIVDEMVMLERAKLSLQSEKEQSKANLEPVMHFKQGKPCSR